MDSSIDIPENLGLCAGEKRLNRRVILFGMDGATWDLLSRFTDDGTMPFLAKLRLDSRWGPLTSTVPPVTAPAWAALSTGKMPGKTGVFAFNGLAGSIDRYKPVTSRNVLSDTFPEILERAGKTVDVVNLPTFSFPTRIKGAVLGDILCPPDRAVHPESLLEKRIFREYRNFPNISLKGDLLRYVQDVRELENVRFRCAQELFMTDWDFLFVMFSGVDWVQHELYRELTIGEDTPACNLARKFFEDIDGYLRWFASNLREEDFLLMASDHGFKVSHGLFDVNRWLAANGYLRVRKSSSFLSRLSPGAGVRIPSPLVSYVSKHRTLWAAANRARKGAFSAARGGIRPDPASIAFSPEYTWGVYLNSRRRFRNGVLDPQQEQEVRKKIKAGLDEAARKGLIRRCALPEEIHKGPFAGRGPDLIIIPAERGISSMLKGIDDDVPINNHSMEGIYLIHGPGIPPTSGAASICDIAPTILTIFGLEVPEDMDGMSLWGEQKTRKTGGEEHHATENLQKEEEDIIKARLRSLGYE